MPLHHSVSEGHVRHGVSSFLMVFFAIWWAWMNFTWFASAYDTDDDVYRITSFVQIAGALVLAAGVRSAFEDGDFAVITAGYVVMQLALPAPLGPAPVRVVAGLLVALVVITVTLGRRVPGPVR